MHEHYFPESVRGTEASQRQPYWEDIDVTECIGCGDICASCGRYDYLDFNEYASFVFEPGNSGGLVLLQPERLVDFLAGKVREAGGRLVVNEVTTGFGRTGKWFGLQHYEAGYFCGFSEQLGFLHLYAPLIISLEEIDGFCSALERVLEAP
ncbi:MAG: aminotransferase class III-fold pyridoxal phosphate-dependent enzyme [Clostridiales bacterium]|nr:aminotransferase class III-fold pyridoxal phosphate-dependent enzyme [Clostridiales bacterium]